MPIYEYFCQQCERSFEVLVRSSTRPACPECGSGKLEKLVSLPTLQGKTAGIIAGARSQALREGHFSNYAPSERPKQK
jgi:putative FmdB family regulatory protein